MPTSPLLARITLALAAFSAAGLGTAACGSDESDGTGGTACLPTPSTKDANGAPHCHGDDQCPQDQGLSRCFAPGQSSCDALGDQGGVQPTCTDDAQCETEGPTGSVCQAREGELRRTCAAKCANDASCGSAMTCDLATGHCLPRTCDTTACPIETFCTPAKVCATQRCNATRPCGEGYSCTESFTCVPTPCTGAAAGECPSTFACDATSLTCQRKTCACDSECGGGFCVAGACYPSLGRCAPVCAAGRPLNDGDGTAIVARLLRGGAWSGD